MGAAFEAWSGEQYVQRGWGGMRLDELFCEKENVSA